MTELTKLMNLQKNNNNKLQAHTTFIKFKNRLNQAIGKIIKNTKGMISTKLQNIDYPKESGKWWVGAPRTPRTLLTFYFLGLTVNQWCSFCYYCVL